jgi:hypothetical protein
MRQRDGRFGLLSSRGTRPSMYIAGTAALILLFTSRHSDLAQAQASLSASFWPHLLLSVVAEYSGIMLPLPASRVA